MRFSPTDGSFIKYTVLDGLQGDEFFPGAYHHGKSGAMYFGGPNGLNVFFPEKIHPDAGSIPVRLSGLQLFNKPVEIGHEVLDIPLALKESIRLRHDQNLITLQYVGLNFKSSGKVQYAYMLEGFDADWNYVGTKREATYTNLDAGDYVFKVKAANSDGLWNEHLKELRITVLPPLWKTPAAYAVYLLLGVGLLYVFRQSALSKERLRNKLKLQQLEAQKTHELDVLKLKFFTNISHEFRTPLTLILGPMERLLTDQALEPDQRSDYYQLINRNAQRLLRLINQLLDLSELDAGFMKLSVVQYDVVSFCRSIAEAFVYQASQQHIDYTFTTNVPVAAVYFDDDKLEKVLYNLISNALKFTPPGGRVAVRLSVTNQCPPQAAPSLTANKEGGSLHLVLEVEDSGVGIPLSQQQKIFERFYQAGSKTRQKAGTGIGLALTRQLVECHYGTIKLQSTEGKGSLFTMCLPVYKERYAPEEISDSKPKLDDKVGDIRSVYNDQAQQQQQQQQQDGVVQAEVHTQLLGLPSILLVEDSEDVRSYIRINLSQEYRIYEAADGLEGYEKALDVDPDLVISDVMMPGMDGFELCRKIKSNPQISHVPVVLLTARSSEAFELEGLETGADDYISKPFNTLLFKARIRNILESRQKIKEKLSTDLSFEPQDVATNSLDERFIKQLLGVIEANISDDQFNPDALAAGMNLSRSQLYKKVKGLTGLSVSILIRNIRLRKACALLKTHSLSISEVAYQVGFSDPAYFTKCFREMYSQSPTEYLQRYS